jgi:hypothetical protein
MPVAPEYRARTSRPVRRPRRPRLVSVLGLVVACLLTVSACGGGSPSGPSGRPPSQGTELPAAPVLLSPVGGAQVATDTPTLLVQNAQGFDLGQAEYTFRVFTASGAHQLAEATAPAGSGTTAVQLTDPLPRGMLLIWNVVARSATAEASSTYAGFSGPGVDCIAAADPFAKRVVDWWISECSLEHDIYNDPEEVLGPPDSSGHGPDQYTGFISLGEGGYVTVDMEACAVDGPGPDVRVYQRASAEPVTLYAAGRPEGPFILIESRKPCGEAIEGIRSGMCEFDLALGEVQEARYLRIEDGELYPCPGTTVTEGADIDAVELLNHRP